MAKLYFKAGRIPPFYSEPWDWCQLTYQQLIIPSAWKLHAVTRYLECQIAIHQVCMGMWHSVIPPLGISLMTDPPSVILKIQRSLRGPKTSSAALRSVASYADALWACQAMVLSNESVQKPSGKEDCVTSPKEHLRRRSTLRFANNVGNNWHHLLLWRAMWHMQTDH